LKLCDPPTDEAHPLRARLIVLSIARHGPARSRQHADLLVVANGLRGHAGRPGNLADGEDSGHWFASSPAPGHDRPSSYWKVKGYERRALWRQLLPPVTLTSGTGLNSQEASMITRSPLADSAITDDADRVLAERGAAGERVAVEELVRRHQAWCCASIAPNGLSISSARFSTSRMRSAPSCWRSAATTSVSASRGHAAICTTS